MPTLRLKFPRNTHESKDFDISFSYSNKLAKMRTEMCVHMVTTRAYKIEDMIRVMRPWFLQNIRRQWGYRSIYLDNKTKWFFEDVSEATLFKLRFGGE